jgi:hypothetical protein
MSLLDRIRRRKPDLSQTDRYRMVGSGMLPDSEQQRMNRELMESQMTASRLARAAEAEPVAREETP